VWEHRYAGEQAEGRGADRGTRIVVGDRRDPDRLAGDNRPGAPAVVTSALRDEVSDMTVEVSQTG
jgi:hypothetical protein